MRITSENITELKANEVFVFGSNLQGHHYGGAAKIAHDKFGAIWGKGLGLIGKSYAIPTLNFSSTETKSISKVPLKELQKYVDDFIETAIAYPFNIFLLTEIGCGIAGFKIEEIAPLFEKAIKIDNIHLPKRFWNILTEPK